MKKLREFKISFIDEGYRGYSVVSGMHQEQVLPYIRNQSVHLHVREVDPAYDALVGEMVEVLKEAIKWLDKLNNHQTELLGHGFEEACNNWDKASDPEKWPEDIQSFSFETMRNILAKYEGYVKGQK